MNVGEKVDFNYTGKPQEFQIPVKGIYQIEVWGAEGGGYRLSSNSDSGDGGKGGYAKGLVTLNKGETIYIYVGGYGKSSISGIANGGWNGGGSAWASSSDEPANGGGGATDVRIVGGAWSNKDSLLSRIIVAGGGGGGGEDAGETGGYGGGETGGSTYGATQTTSTGGGAFGKGAHTPNDGGAGGGGWYGGGTTNGSQTKPTANSSGDTSSTASGGSGYVLTESSYKPDGYIPTLEYHMSETILLNGSQQIPSTTESGTQIGNSGNGLARLTLIESLISIDVKCNIDGQIKEAETMSVKIDNIWKEVDSIFIRVGNEWKLNN